MKPMNHAGTDWTHAICGHPTGYSDGGNIHAVVFVVDGDDERFRSLVGCHDCVAMMAVAA